MLRDQQQGLPIAVGRQTVEQFLLRWLADVVEPNHRPKTYRIYEQIVRSHLVPSVGHHQLSMLTPQHVQAMLRAKSNGGLSSRTVQRIRDVLRNALNQAVRWDLVQRNVATLVDPPAVEPTEIRPLTPEQARILLDAARGDRLEGLYRVALSLGLRQGEALGLRWEDVNFDRGIIRIAVALQSVHGKLQLVKPKTKRSTRVLPLPTSVAVALRTRRARQADERLAAGDCWQESGLVFTTKVGTPVDPRNLLRSFARLLEHAGLPHIRFHDLRHSCASFLAAEGVPARVTMEILGHSDIRLTQNIYTHVFDESKREAANAMERLFGEEVAEQKQAVS